MLRSKGQMALICDGCGAVYDDRPRHKHKDVVAEAVGRGWKRLTATSMLRRSVIDLHLCDKCAKPDETDVEVTSGEIQFTVSAKDLASIRDSFGEIRPLVEVNGIIAKPIEILESKDRQTYDIRALIFGRS